MLPVSFIHGISFCTLSHLSMSITVRLDLLTKHTALSSNIQHKSILIYLSGITIYEKIVPFSYGIHNNLKMLSDLKYFIMLSFNLS